MSKNYFAVACTALLFGIACHENDQQPMSPANGNIYDSPGTRPPRPDAAPHGGTSSMTDMGLLADSGTGMGGNGGGVGGTPLGGAYNASGSEPIKNGNNGIPAGPQ